MEAARWSQQMHHQFGHALSRAQCTDKTQTFLLALSAGVSPSASRAFLSAPARTRISATSAWPAAAALWSAVAAPALVRACTEAPCWREKEREDRRTMLERGGKGRQKHHRSSEYRVSSTPAKWRRSLSLSQGLDCNSTVRKRYFCMVLCT